MNYIDKVNLSQGRSSDQHLDNKHLQLKTQPTPSLSTKLLNIQWSQHFPINILNCGCTADHVSSETAFEFMKKSYKEIFQLEEWKNPFLIEEQTHTKLQYFRECGDFFMIYKDNN